MICSLYSSFMDTNLVKTPPTRSRGPSSPSTPSSGGVFSSPEASHTAINMRRAGSFGSILDSPVSERGGGGAGGGGGGGGRSVLRFGHNRSHSTSSPKSEPKTASLKRKPKEPSVSDPFEELETVWESLECWFDLVNAEVERIQGEQEKQVCLFL